MDPRKRFSRSTAWSSCSALVWRSLGGTAITICGSRSLYIAQRKFQAPIFGVVVMSDRVSDIDRIARQKRSLLQTLCHVPTQGVEDNLGSQLPGLSSQ